MIDDRDQPGAFRLIMIRLAIAHGAGPDRARVIGEQVMDTYGHLPINRHTALQICNAVELAARVLTR